MTRAPWATVLLAASVSAVAVPCNGLQSAVSVWTGVFSTAQADRGKPVYVKHCGRCHGDDLASSRNPLSGDRFIDHWEARTLADLFRKIRDTMPQGEAMTVTDADKIDAMAYILQQNGFPEGNAELPADGDALAAVEITRKTVPGPLKTGTLVRVVGCLVQRNERDWQLTNASEPKRTVLNPTTRAGRERPSIDAGTRTILLLNPFPSPAAHRGHTMIAIGFLMSNAAGDAVNVVSLEMLSPACTQ